MTLTEAQEYLAAIEQSLASGLKTVERAGRSITYADTADMRSIADQLRRDIQRRQGRPSIRVTTWSGCK